MDTRRRSLITYGLIGGTLCLIGWAASAMPALRRTPAQPLVTSDPPVVSPKDPPTAVTIPKTRPKVEVVFALDTTGSMGGLIDGAKRKIWSIATFIAQGQPKPELRIGLVAYRDRGDEYVTRVYDLSDDLDGVFQHLSAFEAGGGGDTPEHVSKALSDAVHKMSWSGEQATLKQIYLVGDAPPHTDYNDGFDYHKVAREAHDQGIHINTIRCGGDRETQVVWNEIANTTAGAYASIDQSGGVMVAASPYDDRMAELNAKLVGTSVGYGRSAGAMRAKAAAAVAVPAATAADRASFFGSAGGAVGGDGDLVRDFDKGAAKPGSIAKEELPKEMQAMDGKAQAEFLNKKSAERKVISAEINALAKRRTDYLKDKRKADAFDERVEAAIKAQGKSVGLAY